MHETLLGFDARVVDQTVPTVPASNQRETYLLRPDAGPILSTDVLLWPSVFPRDAFLAQSPPAGDNFLFLWCNLDRLLNQLKTSQKSYAIIGVTCIDEDESDIHSGPVPQCDPVPANIASGWKLLGYDISDSALLSGLSNCGYNVMEIGPLRRQWAAHLNQNHLFTDAAISLEFRELTDRRVKEHAPFFVYGLYLIESHGAAAGWPEIFHS